MSHGHDVNQISTQPERVRAAWTVARAWPRNPLFVVVLVPLAAVSITLVLSLVDLGALLADVTVPGWARWSVASAGGLTLGFAVTVAIFAGAFYAEAARTGSVTLWLEDETGTATVLLKPDGDWTKAVYLASYPKPGHKMDRGRGRALGEAARDRGRADGRPVSAYALPGLTRKYAEAGLTPVSRPKWGLGFITRLEDHGHTP